jgi:hypothetical protein
LLRIKNEEYLKIIHQYDLDKQRVLELESELQIWKTKYYKLEFQEHEIREQY